MENLNGAGRPERERRQGRRPRPLVHSLRQLRLMTTRLGVAIGFAWRAGPLWLVGHASAECLAGAVPVANIWLVKVALDQIARDPSATAVVALGVGFAGACFAGAVLAPVLRYLHAEMGRAVALLAKDRLYRAIHRIDLLSTLENPTFRDRLRLAEQASQNGPGQVVGSLLSSARAAVTLAGLFGTLMTIAPWLAAVLIVSAAPALVAEVQLSRRRAAVLWDISPAQRRELFFAELLTNLSAAMEIRLFGASRVFHRRMLDELSASNTAQRRYDRRELGVQSLLAGLSATLSGGALVWIVIAGSRGFLTVGEVGAAVVAVGTTLAVLSSVVNHVAVGHHASLLLDHYRELVATPLDTTERAVMPARNPVPVPGAGGDIELVDVWFRYSEDHSWVLNGLNLTIRQGRAVALVGENGAGKSTLVKLLCRFYEPTRGVIRWGGVDIRDIPEPVLRRRIGAVFQDFMCYELTAQENIAVGDVDDREEFDLRQERITAAARSAEILDTLDRLPRGHETLLSRTFVDYATDEESGGVLLSRGQWQRLALARALLRGRRELLILDEPSSGLDAAAEHEIHSRLAEHRRGRTSVLISHRLNTVRDADEIVVLAVGTIIERGTHDELMLANGEYARLFHLQAAGYRSEPTAWTGSGP
jgi:ATP-binding cassette, subfamily B, bacterial